ncbi:hypothetical protein PRIPAC_89416 [Pristionchus pacificus]|uniref:Uncharacterized protein n=1 Tax=Pristionchus pacificus TaxID=54126 RepID=A0A2A6CWP1_PRIPA|nr:hypothetical protein PRIPAC_89416 [Pristionchus pacificus]|eukprot:PDM82605.1 hypothetical protein PRIPAC_36998 [Pristionchus pacificus]
MSDLEANAETLSLDYIKLDQLTDDTQCYQVENGRTFYFKTTSPQRLYIYKAVATMLDTVVVSYVRHMLEVTVVDNAGVITAPEIHTIHRGKIVFAKCDEIATRKNCNTLAIKSIAWRELIRITVPPSCASCGVAFARDTSKYIYVPAHERLHVLDTETEKALPALSLSGLSNITVIGLRERTITLTAEKDRKHYLVTAPLPNGYFDTKKKEEQVKKNPFTKKMNDWPPSKTPVSWQEYSDELQWKKEIRITINELLDKNVELSDEIAKVASAQKELSTLQGTDEETLAAFRMSNQNLEKASEQMKDETQEMRLQLDRNIALNMEIDAANQQLGEEKEILMQELEELNELNNEKSCLGKSKNEPKPLNASQENMKLRAKLHLMLSENENLTKSITGRLSKNEIKDLLTANELMLKQVGRV